VDYLGIVITGTSGSGKTSVARKLCEVHKEFSLVQAVTTRNPREDDKIGEFLHISQEEFGELDKNGSLLIKAKYRDHSYGIKQESVQSVLSGNRVPVLVITPLSVKDLAIAEEKGGPKFLTIFLDAYDDVLNGRLKARGEQLTETMRKQRLDDRDYEKKCIYSILNNDLGKTVVLISDSWEFRKSGGMLPQRTIQLMIECGILIMENANLGNIKGASYDLSLGDEYYYGGKRLTLTAQDTFILVEPFEFVFVTCQEKFNLPRDVAGRFDISVGLFFQGLILSNGPQVDPGFRGGLWCLLFNTSNDTVQLKRGQHYATIDFIKLIEPTITYAGQYQDKEQIGDYLPRKASRSPIGSLKKDIDNLKKEKWWIKILPLVVALFSLAAGVAALIIALKKLGS
jgi:deoxycytidine triphosphate deaminase